MSGLRTRPGGHKGSSRGRRFPRTESLETLTPHAPRPVLLRLPGPGASWRRRRGSVCPGPGTPAPGEDPGQSPPPWRPPPRPQPHVCTDRVRTHSGNHGHTRFPRFHANRKLHPAIWSFLLPSGTVFCSGLKPSSRLPPVVAEPSWGPRQWSWSLSTSPTRGPSHHGMLALCTTCPLRRESQEGPAQPTAGRPHLLLLFPKCQQRAAVLTSLGWGTRESRPWATFRVHTWRGAGQSRSRFPDQNTGLMAS